MAVPGDSDQTSVRLTKSELELLKRYKAERYKELADEVPHRRAVRDLLQDHFNRQKKTRCSH